jgi:hypothetical protein
MFDMLATVTGDQQLAEAERRLAAWLRDNPDLELRGDPQDLARFIIVVLLDVLDTEHVLVLSPTGYRLEHSLRCRLARTEGCVIEEPLRAWLKEVGRPEEPPGRYIVRLRGLKHGRRGSVVLERE